MALLHFKKQTQERLKHTFRRCSGEDKTLEVIHCGKRKANKKIEYASSTKKDTRFHAYG